jgi:hypothetical protein
MKACDRELFNQDTLCHPTVEDKQPNYRDVTEKNLPGID